MVVIIVLLAVPLSRTNPRKGRFAKLLPAVLLYFFYLMALNIIRENMETGEIPIGLTLLPVHAIFLSLGCFLIWIEELTFFFKKLLKTG
jgi:lipopolysaccharide export system permease protein